MDSKFKKALKERKIDAFMDSVLSYITSKRRI